MPIEFDEPTETPDIKPGDDLAGFDSILSEYKDAKVEIKEEPKTEVIEPILSPDETGPVPEEIWRNNPDYYQSGKKRGQKRAKRKVDFKYNSDAKSEIKGSMLINGALFLMVINFVIPAIIAGVNNMISKDKVNINDLKLGASEQKEIAPLMDATLKQLNVTGNPLVLLCITLTASYGMKFLSLKFKTKE